MARQRLGRGEVEKIRALVHEGRLPDARRNIRTWPRKTIPRPLRAFAARTARYARDMNTSIRLLYPLTASRRFRGGTASDEEMGEYAVTLVEAGSYIEAERVLKSINPERFPAAALFSARLSFRKWEWETAIPGLEALIRSGAGDIRIRLLAHLHMGTACVHGLRDFERARDHLDFVIRSASAAGPPLEADARQMKVQSFLFQDDLQSAFSEISELQSRIRHEEAVIPFLRSEEWKAIARYRTDGDTARFIAAMRSLGESYLKLEAWEFYRGTLYYRSREAGDRVGLTRLYFTNPHSGLRARISEALGGTGPPETHLLAPASGDFRTIDCLEPGLKRGGALFRLFTAFTRDLTIPSSSAELHGSVYPDEKLIPGSSDLKVRQLIHRLNRWFANERLDARVVNMRKRYRLEFGNIALLYHRDPLNRTSAEAKSSLALLRNAFGNSDFSAAQTARLCGSSRRTASRLLNRLEAGGFLKRLGRGRSTLFTVMESP